MASYQYQNTISNKNVFRGLERKTIKKIRDAVSETSDKIEDKLRQSYKNGGCSAYDEFRHTYSGKNKNKPHHYGYWTVRSRDSSNTQSLEIRNRFPYTKFLYSELSSPSHNNGFRSAYPHDPVVYTRGGTRVILTRDEQITKARWARCIGTFKGMITKAIKRGMKK